jgi:hypothetical protein
MYERGLSSPREDNLRQRYGEVLTITDLADLFRYPSSQALLKAKARGQFLVPLIKFPKRRGWFATARAVAEFLDSMEADIQPERVMQSQA